MEDSKLHPLDPLKEHYTLSTDGTKRTLSCNHCNKSWWCKSQSGQLRIRFREHMTKNHVNQYSEEYKMTEEDLELKDDFEMMGAPSGFDVHYRKCVSFSINRYAKRPVFVYFQLSKKLNQQLEMDDKALHCIPRTDIFLDEEAQPKRTDFENLPEGYEMGHTMSHNFARFCKFIHDVMNCFPIVAIQARALNRAFWEMLERYLEGLNLLYKVRVFAGTHGTLPLEHTSTTEIARWWHMTIVTCDMDDTNWRYASFLFPNIPTITGNLMDFAVSIYQLNALLGYNVFSKKCLQFTQSSSKVCTIDPEDFEDWAMRKWFSSEMSDIN